MGRNESEVCAAARSSCRQDQMRWESRTRQLAPQTRSVPRGSPIFVQAAAQCIDR